jgi:phenylacetate-CoA ligase
MLTRIYHSLPHWARTSAGTLYGYYLQSWRYGPNTETYVQDAFDREHWAPGRAAAYQKTILQALLPRAATTVPYYRAVWSARRRSGDNSSSEVLSNWPVLEKDEIRSNARAFVAEDFRVSQLHRSQTSGTTGKPLELWQTRDSLREWYGLMEARWRRWYGVSRGDRWAMLGGQLIVPVSQTKPPFWIWNHAFRQLYMSSYHLSDELIPSYLEAMQRYRVTYVWGYTSALYTLARFILTSGARPLRLKVAITNAEPVTEVQRDVISRAFDCPVRETYGMSEMVTAASECEYGRLHLWPRVGVVEVLNNGVAQESGSGELVCTGLLNTAMPLIRYRIGDRGTLAPPDFVCECGRSLPTLLSVEGRVDDVLYTPTGRQVGRLDPVFKADLPVREARIIQRSFSAVDVEVVPDNSWTPEAGRAIAARIRERLGNITVNICPVERIPRGANGKFRAVICEIPAEELRRVSASVTQGAFR